jgi:hypothetical protein
MRCKLCGLTFDMKDGRKQAKPIVDVPSTEGLGLSAHERAD